MLGVELQRAGLSELTTELHDLITLDRPALDWVRLSEGLGVPASRVERAEDLSAGLTRLLAEPGPGLIEAVFS